MSIKGFNISGTTYKVDYPELDNLPQINGTDLVGNMSGESLGLREVAGVFYPGGTNAQIETLLDSGVKVVFVDVPVNGLLNPRTRCPLIKRVSATEHHFATTTQNACVYAICKDNNWSHTVEAYARPSQFPDAALTLPEPLGTAAIGTSMDYARANHVHAMPAAEDVGAIPDPTTKSSGQVLTYNGYSWVARTPSGGGGISSLLVTFSESGGTLTADATFAEVTAAIADGVYVYAKDSTDRYYSLASCNTDPNSGEVAFICSDDPISSVTLRSDDTADSDTIDYATETWVQSQGYLTQHQSLDNYQTKSITDAGDYYTNDTVEGALQEIGAELANIAGKADKTPRVAMTGADTAPTLDPNKLYVFPEMASLSPTFTAPSDNTIVNEYHFIFESGATATTTTFPAIPGLDDFAAEANMAYEVSILEGRALVISWEVSA